MRVVVVVRHLVVLAALGFFVATLVRVVDRAVVVFVDVMVGMVIEDARDLVRLVFVRHVIVVVHVRQRGMDVLVLDIADDTLFGLNAHVHTSRPRVVQRGCQRGDERGKLAARSLTFALPADPFG